MQFNKKYLFGFTAFSLSLLVFKIFSSSDKKVAIEGDKNKVECLKPIQNQQLDHMAMLEEILVHKSAQFDLEYIPGKEGILTSNCILDFLKSTYDLFDKQQIKAIYNRSRQGRRKIFPKLQNQQKIYFRFVCTFEQQIKYLIEKVQKDFTAFLGIEYSVITNTIEHHMITVKFREQLANWTAEIRDIIRNQLPTYEKPLNPQLLQEVLQYQIDLLNNHIYQLKQIVSRIGIHYEEQIQCLPTFLSCYLEDSIYFKFNVENEQLSIDQWSMSLQLYQLNRQFLQCEKGAINELYSSLKDDIIIE